MKILIHSNVPWTGTGYGQQTALWAERFKQAGHDVAVSATWGLMGAGLNWGDVKVYPSDNAWGNRTLPIVAAHHAGGDPLGCLVLTLMDVYVLNSARLADLRMASWCPVDHDPLPPRVLEFFKRIESTPIAMSRFGERKLAEAGLDPLYVPHGIDTNVFQPQPDRDAAREQMRVPEDAFVVGMVAYNQGNAPPRKAFPQVFVAFERFLRKHKDAILYLHTNLHGYEQGINLLALAETCGLPLDAIRWTHQGNVELGLVPAAELARYYTAFDVLANPSLGEGFGIPIVEAQACGCPVIVTDHTSMPEVGGVGWKVGGDLYYDASHGGFYKIPSIPELVSAFEDAYDKAAGMSGRARQFALSYDADRVMADYWTPVLADLEERMQSCREVEPLAGVAA